MKLELAVTVAHFTERLFVHRFQIGLKFKVWVLEEKDKPEDSEKNPRSKARTRSRIRTQAILAGGKSLYHTAILLPIQWISNTSLIKDFKKNIFLIRKSTLQNRLQKGLELKW